MSNDRTIVSGAGTRGSRGLQQSPLMGPGPSIHAVVPKCRSFGTKGVEQNSSRARPRASAQSRMPKRRHVRGAHNSWGRMGFWEAFESTAPARARARWRSRVKLTWLTTGSIAARQRVPSPAPRAGAGARQVRGRVPVVSDAGPMTTPPPPPPAPAQPGPGPTAQNAPTLCDECGFVSPDVLLGACDVCAASPLRPENDVRPRPLPTLQGNR